MRQSTKDPFQLHPVAVHRTSRRPTRAEIAASTPRACLAEMANGESKLESVNIVKSEWCSASSSGNRNQKYELLWGRHSVQFYKML